MTEVQDLRITSAVSADSYQLRRLSANAVRFRLGAQLDWRLDLMLDGAGIHVLSMLAIYILYPDRSTKTIFTRDGYEGIGGEVFEPSQPGGEPVVHTHAWLKLGYQMTPLGTPLDLRLRDYRSLTPIRSPREPLVPAPRVTIADFGGTQIIADAYTPNHH